MSYDPPTLAELYTKVGRDIRDPDHTTLGLDVLQDFINDGIAEINEIKPRELTLTVIDIENLEGLPFNHIWRVGLVRADGFGEELIPPNNDGVRWQNGWTYFANELQLSQRMLSYVADGFDASTLQLVIAGYYDRDALLDETDVFDGTLDDEALLRRYCKHLGFKALEADRNLFQQWQIRPNNSDVSPTQLMGMATSAESDWNRQKRRAYTIRRPAAGF